MKREDHGWFADVDISLSPVDDFSKQTYQTTAYRVKGEQRIHYGEWYMCGAKHTMFERVEVHEVPPDVMQRYTEMRPMIIVMLDE